MMNYLQKQKRSKKGFTLMEMLIVIAIIAILIAIAIPTFTGQLEKAREATDAANLRTAYAEVTAEYMTNGTGAVVTRTVTPVQKTAGWVTNGLKIGNLVLEGTADAAGKVAGLNSGSWTVTCASDGTISITTTT